MIEQISLKHSMALTAEGESNSNTSSNLSKTRSYRSLKSNGTVTEKIEPQIEYEWNFFEKFLTSSMK